MDVEEALTDAEGDRKGEADREVEGEGGLARVNLSDSDNDELIGLVEVSTCVGCSAWAEG